MKINNINYFNYNLNNSGYGKIAKQNQPNKQFSYNNELNAMEFLGRSQVKFTGLSNDDFSEFDKAFFNDISKDLELSREDSDKLKKIVNKFLKKNNYSSTEDLCASFDTDEKYYSFFENVASQLNLSAEKVMLLDNALMNKIMMIKFSKALEEDESLAETIIPFAVKSAENNLVCDKLLEKFKLDTKEHQNILSHLKKLENDISPEQIAYDITDDYKLTSIDDYNYVLKTIKSRDKMLIDFMTENDSHNF